jgi:hypothetical protein
LVELAKADRRTLASSDQWARNFSEPPPTVIDVTPSNGTGK